MQRQRDLKSPVSLRIIIVGGGIGGLSAAYCLAKAGHQIIVLERHEEVKEVGAGEWLTPNGSRLLIRWGLRDKLEEVAGSDRCQALNTFRYTGAPLSLVPFGEAFEAESGFPTYQVHRADLIKIIHEIASPLAEIRLGCQVVSVNAFTPSVTLETGETLSADLIIGADGAHSTVRGVIGNTQAPQPLNQVAYRYLIPAEDILSDPELRPLLEIPALNIWTGPGVKQVIVYGIRSKSLLNVVAYIPDDRTQTLFTKEGDPDVMRAAYAFQDSESCDPKVLKLLKLAKTPRINKWKLIHSEPLDTWIHPSGRVTLIGDACHVFPIEDAAVLGNLFSRLTDRSQIKSLLLAYEEIRRPRATATWMDTMERRKIMHLRVENTHLPVEDTEVQRSGGVTFEPDKSTLMRHRKAHESTIPIHCSHPFGYDADEATDLWWEKNGAHCLEQ